MLLMSFSQLKAQFHIASGVELYVSGSTNLYSGLSFSNAGQLTITVGTKHTIKDLTSLDKLSILLLQYLLKS